MPRFVYIPEIANRESELIDCHHLRKLYLTHPRSSFRYGAFNEKLGWLVVFVTILKTSFIIMLNTLFYPDYVLHFITCLPNTNNAFNLHQFINSCYFRVANGRWKRRYELQQTHNVIETLALLSLPSKQKCNFLLYYFNYQFVLVNVSESTAVISLRYKCCSSVLKINDYAKAISKVSNFFCPLAFGSNLLFCLKHPDCLNAPFEPMITNDR